MSHEEHEVQAAIEAAVKALVRAAELAERVGYGTQVRESLADALRAARYALNTAHDRA